MPLNWAITDQDAGVIAFQRRASAAPEGGEQAGPTSHLLQRQDPPCRANIDRNTSARS